MKMKLELIPVPVTDASIAKQFYVDKIGFNADHDHRVHEGLHFIQLTPPESKCSIVIGEGITEMTPGSLQGLLMVVDDVRAVRDELIGRGVEMSDIDEQKWGTFAYFSDPDGNSWALQELPDYAEYKNRDA